VLKKVLKKVLREKLLLKRLLLGRILLRRVLLRRVLLGKILLGKVTESGKTITMARILNLPLAVIINANLLGKLTVKRLKSRGYVHCWAWS
jgi:hypothetical protein